MSLLEPRTGHWVTCPDGSHVSVCAWPPDERERAEAMRWLFGRWAIEHGVFTDELREEVEHCPCQIEPCQCEHDTRIPY